MMLFSYMKALLWLLLVTAVAPMHAQWSPPTDITEQGTDSELPWITTDPQGNIHVLWLRAVDSKQILQVSSKSPEGDWSAPVTLTEEIQISWIPLIKSDFQGNLIATWCIYDGPYMYVQCSMKSAGGSWSAPFTLSANEQISDIPTVEIDHLGNITVAWISNIGSDRLIQARTKPFGGNWGNIQTVSEAGGSASEPLITFDPEGNVTAVWTLERNSNDFTIQTSTRLFGDENWSAPVTISEVGTISMSPRIVSDNQGNLTVVWQSFNGSSYTIQASAKPYNGNWEVPETLINSTQAVYGSEIAVDHLGNVTVIWVLDTPSNRSVQSRRKLFNGNWEDIVTLSEPGKNAAHPQIKADSQGTLTVIWEGNIDNGNPYIESVYRPYSSIWSAPYILSAPGIFSVEFSLALDTSGNTYAVWRSNINSNKIIQFSKNIHPPTVTSITPSRGPLTGGNEITITGANFIDVVSVFFGAHEAQIISHSPTSITAIAPEGTGEVDVIVFTSYGSSSPTSSSRYSYESSDLLPPSHFRGKRKEHRFVSQTEYYDRLSWRASPDSNVSRYVLYRDDKPVKTFGANRTSYSCKVRNQRANKKSSYRLRAENEQGERSEALAVTVR